MLCVSLSELGQQPCPLQRPKIDASDPAFLDRRTDAGCDFGTICKLPSCRALARAECPADTTHHGVSGRRYHRVAVAEECSEEIPKGVRRSNLLLVPS